MPSVKLSPLFNERTVTSTGVPASGYKIYTYAAGSSSPLATYTSSAGSAAQTNPIILNSAGLPDNAIWLQAGLSYKFILKNASDVQVGPAWDNISGINDTSTGVSQWVVSGAVPTYVSATTFTLVGDQTTDFHFGRRVQLTVTAGTVYGTIISSAYTSLTTITLRMDGASVLDSGLSAVNLSILRADNQALPTKEFDSGDISYVSADGQTITHGLGVVPKIIQVYVHCISADSGYAVGDYVLIPSGVYFDGVNSRGVQIFNANTSTISFVTGSDSTAISLLGKSSRIVVGLTNTKWRIVIRAYA